MSKKRVSIADKNRIPSSEIDTLFKNDYVNGSEKSLVSANAKEIKLRKIEDIKDYYDNFVGGKQVSIYLPEEIHSLVKAKASRDKISMKDAIKRWRRRGGDALHGG